MPKLVWDALVKSDLLEAYENRPPYQQNDYLGWIARAKRETTAARRLAQMLDELRSGDRYMKMPYAAREGDREAEPSDPGELFIRDGSCSIQRTQLIRYAGRPDLRR